MIFPASGEIQFNDGFRIIAHAAIQTVLRENPGPVTSRALAARGWDQHILGEHPSSFGTFEVEVASDPDGRVAGVFLSHVHAFYHPGTPDDGERRVFHEGVIAADLHGQREFSWGHVLCQRDEKAIRDWLVVIYSPFAAVASGCRETEKVLRAQRELPGPLRP